MITLDGSDFEEWRQERYAERKRVMVEDAVARARAHHRMRLHAADGPRTRRRLVVWRAMDVERGKAIS